MGRKYSFEITFEKDQDIFQEGDHVLGFVRIVNSIDISYKALKVEMRGTAVAFWGSLSDKMVFPNFPAALEEAELDPWIEDDCSQDKFFRKTILVDSTHNEQGISEPTIMAAGDHSIPFETKLPLELPSTFDGQRGCVHYEARLIVEDMKEMIAVDQGDGDDEGGTRVRAKKYFTVINGLDLSFIPEAAAKIEVCKYRDFGVCCTEGSVTCDWTISRSGFVPGEVIVINGSIQNESKRTITKSTICLIMIVDYTSVKRRKRERREVAGIVNGPTRPGDMTACNEQLTVPVLPPTGLGRCRLIDISYQIEFKAVLDGAYSPIVISKDVYIGTVKLCVAELRSCTAALYHQPYPVSNQRNGLTIRAASSAASELSLTEVIATACAVAPSEQPSAPEYDPSPSDPDPSHPPLTAVPDSSDSPAVVPEAQECPRGGVVPFREEFDRPPPFAPGHTYDASLGDDHQ